jgi:hypothetical protein
MLRLCLLLTGLLSGSAFAQMSHLYNSDGTSGAIHGSPNRTQQDYDSRGNTGIMFNNPQSGISHYYFMGPRGMMQETGTLFSSPSAMPPIPPPTPHVQPSVPMQSWTPSTRTGRLGR